MFHKAETELLKQTFHKARIHTRIVELSQQIYQCVDSEVFPFLADQLPLNQPLETLIPAASPGVLYRLRTVFECRYLFMLLPETSVRSVLVIGPYLAAAISSSMLLELAEAAHLPADRLPELTRCYGELPVLPDDSHLFLMLESYCESLWRTSPLTVEDIATPVSSNSPNVPYTLLADQSGPWDLHALEQRYSYENALLDAVSQGQLHKAEQLMAGIAAFSFEQRSADALRNIKNYCIVMNTLLRKAAEKGGVHPLYLDRASSHNAVAIEQSATVEVLTGLMTEMFREYCGLVRSCATQQYSAQVQRVILYIDGNLTEELNLHTLAAAHNISAGYLSSLFRKETGTTLTDYVNQRRVARAAELLSTTKLQVQTVGQYSGFMDVQYFSRMFKRIVGMSPREYRSSHR